MEEEIKISEKLISLQNQAIGEFFKIAGLEDIFNRAIELGTIEAAQEAVAALDEQGLRIYEEIKNGMSPMHTHFYLLRDESVIAEREVFLYLRVE